MSKYIPELDRETGQMKLVKRPKEVQGLPYKTKVKNTTFILQKSAHPVISGRAYFNIKVYDDDKLTKKYEFSNWNLAEKNFKKLVNAKKKEKR